MPELPEVETIKQDLNRVVKNKTIKSVQINLAKQVKNPRAKFLKLVQGSKIKNIQRRAKTLIFNLSNGYHLVFHLKLTGQLIYRGKNKKLAGSGHPIKHDLQDLPNKYSHVIFNFIDGSQLFFNDMRQFGRVKLVDDKELEKINKEFGPEPLDKNFTFKKFQELIATKPRTPIKPLLMEQNFIAGIGNIYSQEACFCAGIMPTCRAGEIKDVELKKLYNCLRKILKFAVEKRGASADTYVDILGRQGKMVPFLKVYGRAGEKCFKCGATIKSIKQNQRTTCFCPRCQR